MTQASRFLFDNDFRRPGAAGSRAVAEAEERGRAAGIAAGLAQAQTSLPARLAEAAERLAGAVGALLADAEARHARIEEEAVAFPSPSRRRSPVRRSTPTRSGRLRTPR